MNLKVEDLEKEFAVVSELSKRLEKLKQKLPEYFSHQHEVFSAFEELENQFVKHLEDEKKFLESLPNKIRERIDNEKSVLKLRKELFEMLKPSE